MRLEASVRLRRDNAAELKRDLALVCDTGMWDAQTPSITTSLRGLVYEEVKLTCADRDLHSGLFGGAARNPIHVLADILSAMHKPDGSVAIPGFYDGVHELPPDIKADLAGLGLTAEKFLRPVGLKEPAGEKGRMLIEQISTRPTAEVNGIIGGYTGEGAKTVIPGKASAKVSFRLVGAQDPEKIRAAFREFVRARLPADCTCRVRQFRLQSGDRSGVRQPGAQQGAQCACRGVGQEGGDSRRRRFNSDRRRFQECARHGHADGRFRARRRPRAFAERKVRPQVLPQGYPQLGSDSRSAGGMIARSAAHASIALVFSKCAAARRSSIGNIRTAANGGSFDHLVGGGEEGGRESNAEGFGGLEVDPQRESGRLLDWQVRGFGAARDLVSKLGRPPCRRLEVGAVRHESARIDVSR